MKLTIDRVEFLKGLNFVAQCIPSKSAENLYLNVLIEVNEDSVTLVGSDGKITSAYTIDNAEKEVVLNSEKGLLQTPANFLINIVSNIDSPIITLESVDSSVLNISDNGESEFNVVIRDGDEYPTFNLSSSEEDHIFKAPLSTLKLLYDATQYATAIKSKEPVYTGINIKHIDRVLTFSATDAYRVTACSRTLEDGGDDNFSFTSTKKALDILTKIAEEGVVTLSLNDQRALYQVGRYQISTTIYSGEFFDIRNVIPDRTPYSLKMKTADFLPIAKSLSYITNYDNNKGAVKLTLSKTDGAVFKAMNETYGNGQKCVKNAEITMPEDREVFEIAFNINHVEDAVRALHSETFTMLFKDYLVVFSIAGDDPLSLHILTPQRIY